MGAGSFLYRSAWNRSSASHFLWKPEFVPSFLSVRGHPCCGSWCLSPGLSAVHNLGPPSHPSPLAAAQCGALLWRCTRFCRLSGSPSSFFGSFAHTAELGAAFLEGSCPFLPFDWSKQVLPLPLSHQHCRRGQSAVGWFRASGHVGDCLLISKPGSALEAEEYSGNTVICVVQV